MAQATITRKSRETSPNLWHTIRKSYQITGTSKRKFQRSERSNTSSEHPVQKSARSNGGSTSDRTQEPCWSALKVAENSARISLYFSLELPIFFSLLPPIYRRAIRVSFSMWDTNHMGFGPPLINKGPTLMFLVIPVVANFVIFYGRSVVEIL